MVFLSLGLRAIVNVEALNMVESVGNVARHRKAAIVFKRGSSYVVRWVPAISGESMAHSYQSMIVTLATQRNLPLCTYCSKREFVKHADRRIFGITEWEQKLRVFVNELEEPGKVAKSKKSSEVGKDPQKVMERIESDIVFNCVVEDIGGFLYAGKIPVKRTSRFACSFMVPALDAIEKAVVESQFQVRHAPTASQMWEQAQMPYNVEVGSAVYAWSFYIDLAGIGCTSSVEVKCLESSERLKRIELAIDALALMLDSRLFGAKQSRYMPVIGYETLLVSISKPLPFNVSPPAIGLNFVKDTVERAKAFKNATGSEVKIYGYAGDGEALNILKQYAGASDVGIEIVPTIMELFSNVKETVRQWFKP